MSTKKYYEMQGHRSYNRKVYKKVSKQVSSIAQNQGCQMNLVTMVPEELEMAHSKSTPSHQTQSRLFPKSHRSFAPGKHLHGKMTVNCDLRSSLDRKNYIQNLLIRNSEESDEYDLQG